MTVTVKRDRYRSIEEIRSSLYPGSAAMLNLDRDDQLELPIGMAIRSIKGVDEIASRAAEHAVSEDDD
jgi:hypothetical protein